MLRHGRRVANGSSATSFAGLTIGSDPKAGAAGKHFALILGQCNAMFSEAEYAQWAPSRGPPMKSVPGRTRASRKQGVCMLLMLVLPVPVCAHLFAAIIEVRN